MSEARPPGPVVLRVERTFTAPAEAVFEAWTRPEVLRHWWAPEPDWETPIAEADVRIGGTLRIVMRNPDGEEFGGRGEYLEVMPCERLVFTWTWDGHKGHEESQLVEVEFNDQGDGTTAVVVTNRGLEDEESRESHREGWEGSLANLERLLQGGGITMDLSSCTVRASVAVSDISRAAEFYEGKLGLRAGPEQSDESRIYACGDGTSLHLYVSPTPSVPGGATRATWYAPDLGALVDELASRGVSFERYDDPRLRADEKGIHELDDGRVAWFSDPDGNTFAIEEGTP